ncbi:MAG: cell division protein MraZ [Bacteroidetes bacterium CG02_land_8_20_14_3_00_31_25]|nr:division/cell wall cluster transcriptional repressor MraZ [Bacteroidota bacterium]PIV58122.1 MAG: cell division protein MraZ [Bacteroidetes bacterium CG02_land_8_20_14_3_00_31_25]PIX35864.1 MAG: cell division protein MraZ [Bacteroidetes bacterium CG_4_8_14_3_um_filter_31_14]PIY03917.1 MAG: cell division protein MraZ [Bacteroidetes bacterium CG_4_10_14_3_um_filter_31_20]
MTTFIGDYPCKADSKGRIMLPSALKKQMAGAVQDRFVVKKDIFEKCLVLFPFDEWERQIKILRSKINPYNREHNKFLREFYKGTAEITLDGNNRMLIPRRLLEWAGILSGDVILAGQDGRILVLDKNTYESAGMKEDDFASLAEKILGGIPNEMDND